MIEDVLGPGGALARAHSGYEHRTQQILFADAVARTFDAGGVLLAEAGTGTGKTLAYLTAIAESAESGKRVVISTGTRNLQDQLLNDDIPLLERALGRSLEAVCLKGLSNYLCQRRFDALRKTAPLLTDSQQQLLERIHHWTETTSTGDRAELTDIPEQSPLWGEVCATSETRLGPRCPFHETCFVTRARRAALEARCVVVNHHLFFADLALRNEAAALLPPYDAVVFDEAHQIDAVATAFFGYRVSSRQLVDLARDTLRALRAAGREDQLAPKLVTSAEPLIENLEASASAFFQTIANLGKEKGRAELTTDQLSGDVEKAYFRLDNDLEALGAFLGGLPLARDENITGSGRRAEQLRADLGEILGPQSPTSVHWREASSQTTAVGASPIDVSNVLRELVFYQVDAVALTSATLTVDGRFDFTRERLGLDFEVEEILVESPFDYERQAALYLPAHAPDPRKESYQQQLAELIVETAAVTRGGALALFTNLRDMKLVTELIRSAGEYGGIVRAQGEAPRHALLDELRFASEPMLLLATASFWEGVDVPGEALELVVIARLPFASPADPLVAARLRQLESDNRNPFMEYQVPLASLALKQGFGRLIRTRDDEGVVALLDRRAWTMGYGKVFLRSLPPCTILRTQDELRDWWGELDGLI